MANPIYELDPVTHITAGALGEPGQRTFFIQAERGLQRIDLLCEKQQVQALADAIDEMVANLEQEFGVVRHTDLRVDEAAMLIKEPIEPLFRVGAMGLGEERDPLEVRCFASRAQMQVLSVYARDVIGRGRRPEIVVLQAEAHARRNGHGE
jgi:hypothetical protein